MTLILGIDAIVVCALVAIALTKGFEETLPFFAFVVTLVPGESTVPLPGLFDLTTARVAIATLIVLYFAVGTNAVMTPEKRATPLKYLILLTLGWSLISVLNSVVFTTSLKSVASTSVELYVLYYIFANSVSNIQSVNKILAAIMVALFVCCIFGWLEDYAHWRVVDIFPQVTYRFSDQGFMEDDRVRSTFPHAILFAGALAWGIPITLYFLTLAKTNWQKTYLWIIVIAMFWNIYRTFSRGPWLGLSLSMLLLLLFSQSGIRKYLLVISLLTALVLVIRPGVWETIKNTYFETLDPDSPRGSSYQYRYDLMHVARDTLAKHPSRAVWGFGPESFYYLHLEGEDPTTGHTVKYESCDSAIVEIMMDTGYVGLLLVAALMLKPALVSLRAFASLPKPTNLLCLVLFINLVAFGFMMMSVMNWGWGQQTYMLWIILSLCMVYPVLTQHETVFQGNAIVA